MALRRFVPRLSLKTPKSKSDDMGARGSFRRPLDPSRAERRPRDILLIAFSLSCQGSASAGTQRPCVRGAGELLCGMLRVSTNIDGTAALCRPNMPHTLRSPPGGVKAATRALTPRDPVFPSFPEKKENKKSGGFFAEVQYQFTA